MSANIIDNNDLQLTVNTSSAEVAVSSLPRALDASLNHVASNANDYLDNLEPELVRISHSTAGHTAIAPAPMSQAQLLQRQNDLNGSALPHLGPTSIDTAIVSDAVDNAKKVSMQPQKGPKAKRLGRACDACSRRKVKCDHARPCNNCKDLNLECTSQRPAKRRGPVNRIAEELKRRKQISASDETAIDTAFASPEPDDADAPTSFVSAELLGSFEAILEFIHVFYLYVYPLYPFPHEPIFMHDLQSRSDIQNSQFVALIASVVGATVVAFPRLARKICSEHDLVFDHMIDRCLKVATDLRGAQFMFRAEHTIEDAITSFFLGLVGARTKKWAACRLFWAESESISQMIQVKEDQGNLNQRLINVQFSRRLQTSLFIELKIIQESEHDYQRYLIYDSHWSEDSLPLAVDDKYVHSSLLKSHPTDKIAIPMVLIAMARIYRTFSAIEKSSPTMNERERLSAIVDSIANIKEIILAAPAGLTSPFTPAIPTSRAMEQEDDRAAARLDVQKVALQLTALTCRTQAALKLRQLGEKGAKSTVQKAQKELESIAMELALLLKRVEHLHVEPQWSFFFNKMKIMLAPMQEMKETNEDAAFVVARMADFEQ